MILRFFLSRAEAEIRNSEESIVLLFYTEDSTCHVVKHPTAKDSTSASKVVLYGRQRLLLNSSKSSFVKLENITNSEFIDLRGKRFFVIGCDPVTADYLKSTGLRCPPVFSLKNVYVEMEKNEHMKVGDNKDVDQEILCDRNLFFTFFGEFTDEPIYSGLTVPEALKVEILFYPYDSTVEVFTRNFGVGDRDGQEKRTRYLKRHRISKDIPSDMYGPQAFGLTQTPVLNISGAKDSFVVVRDHQPSMEKKLTRMTLKDWILGKIVEICGRKIRLCECSDFTSDFFKRHLQIDQNPVAYDYLHQHTYRVHKFEKDTVPDGNLIPEISVNSAIFKNTIVQSPLKIQPRSELNDVILRFEAILAPNEKLDKNRQNSDKNRRFVVSIFAVDNSISIYETPMPNSGRRCGVFFSRGYIQKSDDLKSIVEPKDFCIGCEIDLNKHIFLIQNADEFTLNFMEKNCIEFPQSNYENCRKICHNFLDSERKNNLQIMMARSWSEDKTMPLDFALNKLLSFYEEEKSLTKHHLLTLLRGHRTSKPPPMDKHNLAHLACLYVKRVNFNGMGDLRECLKQYDEGEAGRLKSSEVRKALLGVKIPLPVFLLDCLISSYETSSGEIVYNEFINQIDPVKRPRLFCQLPCELSEGDLKSSLKSTCVVDCISLLNDLYVSTE